MSSELSSVGRVLWAQFNAIRHKNQILFFYLVRGWRLKRRSTKRETMLSCFKIKEAEQDQDVRNVNQKPEPAENAEKEKEDEAGEFLNLSKLYSLACHEYAIAMLLIHFLRYVIFIVFFAVIVLIQRNALVANAMSSGIKNKFLFDTFRDAGTYEILGWNDVADFGNFWDYHRGPFLKNFYTDDYINGKKASAYDRQMIESHIKIVGGFRIVQRRAKNGTCNTIARFNAFDSTCYGFVSPDGLLGNVDKSDFFGAKNQSNVYKFQELPTSLFIFKEEGYYQVDFHAWSYRVGWVEAAIHAAADSLRPH
jgi:hypothetical protein